MRQMYPKILPWVASKAGGRDDKAEVLWIEALRDASDSAAPESSEYWEIAVNHLRESLPCRACAGNVSMTLRQQSTLTCRERTPSSCTTA
ncbi:hypothetical protein [Candidatus Accumulibacter sp. ACC003]|uniref:hypothetical protein n=1 Tax=Candidatus Accumulibacter sp. ACC003 TaxID=2823334 RepID=UPI0025B8A542|nr:hypothetical protein [Candidatus Accumulibacter sp. ACC003]